MSISQCPCLYVHVFMSPCLHVSMSPFLHFSMSPCQHFSISPCLHVSMSPFLHFYMSPCQHFSMFACLHVHIYIFRNSMSPKYSSSCISFGIPCCFLPGIPRYSGNFANGIPWNSAEVKINSETILTSAQFQKSSSVDILLQTKTELTEKGNFCKWKNRNAKLPFVCRKRKRKSDVCFTRSTNDKR